MYAIALTEEVLTRLDHIGWRYEEPELGTCSYCKEPCEVEDGYSNCCGAAIIEDWRN